MNRPRLRADYQAVPVPDGDAPFVAILGEGTSYLIEDAATVAAAPLLDGTRTLADVVDELADRHSRGQVLSAVRGLDARGLVVDGPTGLDASRAAVWDARSVDPDRAESRSRRDIVTLASADGRPAAALAEYLAAAGVSLSTMDVGAGHGTGLLVVATQSMIEPGLARLNAARLRSAQPWLLIRPYGNVLILGPHFIPGRTGCWECLRQRWQANEPVEELLRHRRPDGEHPVRSRAEHPAHTMLLAGMLAAELPVLAEHGESARITGRLVTLDTRDLTVEGHDLTRQPQCPACGDPDLLRKADPRVEIRTAPATVAGRSVDRTLERLSRHVSPYLGVVTRLGLSSDPTDGVTFAIGARHYTGPPRTPADVRGAASAGKGRTAAQAKVSALAESVERYSGIWRDDRPTTRSSYARLGPDLAVHLRDLLLFSERQYADRDRLNTAHGGHRWIPRPQPDDLALDWTVAWSLTADTERAVPAAYCWYGHPDHGLRLCAPDSNGCAAGNTREEAILRGFYELVERDGVALWWNHRSLVPGVDLASFGDPWIDTMVAFHRDRLGRDLWVLDVTADLGVPTFAAISRRVDPASERVLTGYGADLDPAVALTRALTEVNQGLPTGGLWPDLHPGEQPWLRPDPRQRPTDSSTYRAGSAGDPGADVRRCVDMAAGAGLETLVVDQTRPDLDLPVVRVIVPGLVHFLRRLGPGRLWEVPARLGRAPLAVDEDGVNPYECR